MARTAVAILVLRLSGFTGCVALLLTAVLLAADPPYAGRWQVNEDKSDYGPAFNFAREESGALRLTEGNRSYIVRFDGKEYPHPLGGVVRWTRIDDRSWEMTLTQNGSVIGNPIYRLSDDGRTLTTRPKSGPGDTLVYRRTSGERQGLVGAWSLKTASTTTLELQVGEGYDLVFNQGPATVRANFDGRDYPTSGPETVRIAKVGDRGFSSTVSINGNPVVLDTFTVSADGQTLSQVGGAFGQPPTHTIVYDRRR
jgi:hypothetical protein